MNFLQSWDSKVSRSQEAVTWITGDKYNTNHTTIFVCMCVYNVCMKCWSLLLTLILFSVANDRLTTLELPGILLSDFHLAEGALGFQMCVNMPRFYMSFSDLNVVLPVCMIALQISSSPQSPNCILKDTLQYAKNLVTKENMYHM